METRCNYHFFASEVNGIPEVDVGKTASIGRRWKSAGIPGPQRYLSATPTLYSFPVDNRRDQSVFSLTVPVFICLVLKAFGVS
jgi:hypothetical protein